MRKLLSALVLLLGCVMHISAAVAYDGCPDFSDLNASYVEPFASGEGDVLVYGRHTLMTKSGWDQQTARQLNVLPDGETWSVKLGNENAGSQQESLSYLFTPDKENPFLRVKYAVVLQNPNHPKEDQPYFSVSITDEDGNPLTVNASYEVYAQEGLDGFNECTLKDCSVLWRDLPAVVLDLSPILNSLFTVAGLKR